MDGIDFLSHIQIQKVSVINSDIDSKGYSIIPIQRREDKKTERTKGIIDLIESFHLKHRLENPLFFSQDLDIVYYFYMKVFEEFLKDFERGQGSNCSFNFEEIHSFSSVFPKKIKEKLNGILKESICILTGLKAKTTGQLRGVDDNIEKNEELDKKLNLKITLSKFSSHKVLSKLNDLIIIIVES
jgi:hypothetical protein